MKRLIVLLSALIITTGTFAQQSVNALFIGNSYTEVNNLPQMISDIADNMGDRLTFQSSTPGGCTFSQHCNNQSMTLIRRGGWDVVVLQEQSQYPSFPQQQVENEVFPYAKCLVDSIYANSPCAEPMFYMTWGRKNGDQQNAQIFPILGTYEGMDSMLYERYMYMAEANDASVCPVGRVWRWLRNNSDIELYQSDGSHPSVAGTYAAACSFYTLIFHQDPSLISFQPSSLSDNDAQTIRNAAHNIVYTQMEQWLRPIPNGDFDYEILDDGKVKFNTYIAQADSAIWDFGDGVMLQMTAEECENYFIHQYTECGDYTVLLIASRHCMMDSTKHTIHIDLPQDTTITAVHNLLDNTQFVLFPNPTKDIVTIQKDNNTTECELLILTEEGNEIERQTLVSFPATIDLSRFQSGKYIFLFKTRNGVAVRKVVKL